MQFDAVITFSSPLGNKTSERTANNFKETTQNIKSDRISTAQFVATSKRDTLSNNSNIAKKTSLPQSLIQARSPSPKLISSTLNSTRITSPSPSYQKSYSSKSPASFSNGGIPVHKTSLPIATKNVSTTSSSRIPLPK